MRNKTLLRVIKVLGFISFVSAVPAAQALQLTISVPDCPSGQSLSFNPTTSTLACGGSTTPDPNTVPTGCTISGNNTSPNSPNAPSTLVTLTASCSGGATPVNFQWTIAGIPVGTNSQLSTSPTGNTLYVVTPSNSIGTGSAASTTVYVGTQQQQPTSAPGNCFVSQSPNTANAAVTAGSNVSLSVTCSSGNAPTSCSWSGGIASTSCFVNVTPQATTTYTVTASNSGGNAAAVTSTVTIGGAGNTGGNPGPDMCSSGDLRYTVNWPSSGQVRLTTSGFGNQRASFKVTIPTTFSPALNVSHLGVISMSEIPGTPTTPREFTVSKSACDFSSGTYVYNGMGFAPVSPSVAFTVNNPNGYFSVGGSFNLNAGETYFINVRNSSFGVPACGYSACDLLYDFSTPNRY